MSRKNKRNEETAEHTDPAELALPAPDDNASVTDHAGENLGEGRILIGGEVFDAREIGDALAHRSELTTHQLEETPPPPTAAQPPATDAPAEPPATGARPLAEPYRVVFSCTPKGFELGENRRYKQRVFTFREKPEPDVLQRLKEAGYVYRPQEKAWTIQADPRTRVESDLLAKEFAGTALEADSGRGR